MHRFASVLVAIACAAGCTDDDARREDPKVVNAVSPRCETNERYVMDVCRSLGPDDGCDDVGDACIALCDQLASCTTVSGSLRVVLPRPTAPDGYCVECSVP